jgi:HEAT repeat protein
MSSITRVFITATLLAGLLVGGEALGAQQTDLPQVENAQVQTRAVAGTLAASVADWEKSNAEASWIGYAVDASPGNRNNCWGDYTNSSDSQCGTCRLENSGEHSSSHATVNETNSTNQVVKLEGSSQLLILLRVRDHQIGKIQLASENCTLDARGLHFTWLTGVKPADSVSFLSGQVRAGNTRGESSGKHEDDSVAKQALTAIALHAAPEAEAALESFTAPTYPEELRKHAAFWLGAARGKEGVAALQKMAHTDPSSEIRAHVAFALFVSKEPGALNEMIRMAHEDESAHVRSQALFWLAQKAGKRAMNAIDAAIQDDPDTEVKKKAVFALSQLPKDEGVPKLIQVAETNRNPAVRKQAMFWLGQSNDPRALQFFEKVLSR